MEEITNSVDVLCKLYKLTLNDPDTTDDLLEIHFSYKANGELHMSHTGIIVMIFIELNLIAREDEIAFNHGLVN
jgi:hypothetical protein